MFPKEVYIGRRAKLREKLNSGLALFLSNPESPMNAPANTFHYRQDSSFLYFFGLNFPGVIGIIDVDNDNTYLFGDDVTLDDIIWMGPQPSLKETGEKVGVEKTAPYKEVYTMLAQAVQSGRKVHFLPQYRAENKMLLEELIGLHSKRVNDYVSETLIKAVVSLREIKDEYEIQELEKAADVGYKMHLAVMRNIQPGIFERELTGIAEGIPVSHDGMASFPIILSQNGETLHNHYHGNKLEPGRLLLCDMGAETPMGYASDYTRTLPVSGSFTDEQKAVYDIVLQANNNAAAAIQPGVTYLSVHTVAAETIMEGLKGLGLVKGDPREAVAKGAHALFMPHGLGHAMGLDVHDMESLGEDYVGYDQEIKRSTLFGFSGLRLGKKLKAGFVLTNEPGIYFIPELIDRWSKEGKFAEFINYDKVKAKIGFGGIRLEDDLLVAEQGSKLIGKRLPITTDEVEAAIKNG